MPDSDHAGIVPGRPVAFPGGELGSRANKRLRDAGLLPGVIYGHKEAVVPVTLPKKEVVIQLNKGTHLFDLSLEGTSQKVLVKEVQYDHLGSEVIHVDFYLPGCPPPADRIKSVVAQLLAGQTPKLEGKDIKFG